MVTAGIAASVVLLGLAYEFEEQFEPVTPAADERDSDGAIEYPGNDEEIVGM
jgi:hypothetical protein